MKKYVILGTLLLVLVAAAAAAFLLPPWLAVRAWEGASDRLARRIGRTVRADAVDFSLFSPLVVRGVTVSGAEPDAPPLLHVDRIEVDLDPWTVLSGPLDVRRVLIEGPRVTVPLAPGGAPDLGDLPDRLRSLAGGAADEPAGGAADTGDGGGLLTRVLRATPQIDVTGAALVLLGPGLSAYAALAPGGALPDEGLTVENGAIVIRNVSLLSEEPVFEVSASADVPALDQQVKLAVRFEWNARTYEATLDGANPFTWALGDRTLSVGGLAVGSGTGLRVRDVALSHPSSADPAQSERPFVRVKEIALTLDDGPPADDPAHGSAFAALSARVARVDFVEPEIYFSRDPEARTPIADLEERLYVDELDARIKEELDEDLAIDDEPVADEKPEPAPRPGQRRRIKPEGELVRAWVARQFEKVEASFASFTDVVHRAGTRLPVRAVHVRRGRFLYEDAAKSGSVSRRLYNFFLDAERRLPEQVFAFKMHFETPDAERTRNRVEGTLHLLTRDLRIQFRVERIELERYRPLLPASFRLTPESVLYDTDLTLTYSSEIDELRAQGRVFMRDFEIFLPGLAPEPLEDMGMGADFDLTVDFAGRRATLAKSRIYLNDVAFTVEGSVEDYQVAPRIHAAFTLERTDAMTIVRSIPRALIPQLAGVQITGSLALTATLDLDTADLNTLDYRIDAQPVGLVVTDMGPGADLKRLEGTFLHTVHERDGTETTFRVGPDAPNWVPLGDVSRYVVLALTTTEDGSFFTHHGFSPTQIRRSIIANLERGYFYRGASTISQQLVKNLFLTRDKTISRKLQEMFITWQMEQRVPKERILELYLNVIEWGPGIYGIRKAAEHYFGKHPADLTLLDTAFLVSIIPNPRRFYHQFERGEVTPRWRDRLKRIIEAMMVRGKVTEYDLRAAAPYSPYFIGRPQPRTGNRNGDSAPPPQPSAPVGVRDNDIPLPPGH